MKVLVADPIGKEGIDFLLANNLEVDVKTDLKPEELIAVIPDYDALIVRSQTKVTEEVIKAGKKLQVVGRAGVGVDNIDLNAATQQGLLVVNAPESNTLSAAEHTIGLMLALARNVAQAHFQLKNGIWDRKRYVGVEVLNKTLGIIGLGKVGTEVAKRANGLKMKILGFDPVVSPDHAKGIDVELVSLEQLFKESDFITVHVPMTDSTRNLIDADAIKMMKPSARLINVARGGIINEQALLEAVEEGRIAGAAIDVFTKEPATESILLKSDKIVVTPHLGASTTEAQKGVAVDVAEQIVDVLSGKSPAYVVNAPMIPADMLPFLTPFVKLASQVGKLVYCLGEGQLTTITIKYEGEIANYKTEAIKAAVIGELLQSTTEGRVNVVNAGIIAQSRGLKIIEQTTTTCENYGNLITIEVATTSGAVTVAGTIMRDEPHIVRVNEYWLNIVPTGGYWLFSDHLDRPGIIAAVATVTGEADINISSMHVARLQPRGRALMVLALDEPLTEELLKKLLAIQDIYTAKAVEL